MTRRLITPIALLLLLTGCSTSVTSTDATTGRLESTRLWYDREQPQVQFSFYITNATLHFLLIDARPPADNPSPLFSRLHQNGTTWEYAPNPADLVLTNPDAKDGLILVGLPDGKVLISHVNASQAGDYIAHHWTHFGPQVSGESHLQTLGLGQPFFQYDGQRFAGDTGRGLLATLAACPTLRDDWALQSIAAAAIHDAPDPRLTSYPPAKTTP